MAAIVRDIRKFIAFLHALATDPRVPARDKIVLAAIVVYLVSPLDFIPDWIPVLGYLDDAVVIILVLDYVFNALPEEIVLSHYPWGADNLRRMRRKVRYFTWFIPGFVRRFIWARIPENTADAAPRAKTDSEGEGDAGQTGNAQP